MLKRILVVLFVCVSVVGFAVKGISAGHENADTPVYTMARICIWPTIYWPKDIDVHGLSLGIPATGGHGEYVAGLDFALLFCATQDVRGLQVSPFNVSSNMIGWQVALVNLTKDVDGLQGGIFNRADNAEGLQLGLVNYAKKTGAGIQIGLINIMENGFLPVFPIFNFSLD